MSAHREARAGRSKDAPPQAPEPVAPAHVVLRLQSQAGNAAVARVLARAPAETEGHQELSWARPVADSGGRARPRRHDPLPHEGVLARRAGREVVRGWRRPTPRTRAATSASPTSRRASRAGSSATPTRAAPPAPTTRRCPSSARTTRRGAAARVRQRRAHDRRALPLRARRGRRGARAAAADAPAAEGNLLAPFRKAEIFLAGQASEPSAPPPKVADPPEDKRVKPPTSTTGTRRSGSRATTRGRQVRRVDRARDEVRDRGDGDADRRLDGDEGDNIDETLNGRRRVRVRRADMPKIRFKKPPWWEDREHAMPPTRRGGRSPKTRSSSTARGCSSATTSRRRSGLRSTSSSRARPSSGCS